MDIIRGSYYIHGPCVDKINICRFICHERWALHVVIKRNVFLHLFQYTFWHYTECIACLYSLDIICNECNAPATIYWPFGRSSVGSREKKANRAHDDLNIVLHERLLRSSDISWSICTKFERNRTVPGWVIDNLANFCPVTSCCDHHLWPLDIERLL